MEKSLILLITFLLLLNSSNASKCKIYNFGDSNIDTGSNRYCNTSHPFGYPCRASNRLLYIDYICERLRIDWLLPYEKAMHLKSTSGANFAVFATTIEPREDKKFPLNVQIAQFARFQNHTYGKHKSTGKRLQIIQRKFKNAIFSTDIGQNDCYFAAISNSSSREILDKKILGLVERIGDAMKKLFQLGGRKFLVYNTGPLGYLPMVNKDKRKDFFNSVAGAFNKHLRMLCVKLQSDMKNARIVYGDIYIIKNDLVTNFSKYGFKNATEPCKPAKPVCRSVFCDIAHYSDAANKIVASKLWTGDYLSPHTSIEDLCNTVMKN